MLASVLSTAIGVGAGRVAPASGFFFVLKYVEYFFIYFIAVNHVTDERQIRRFVVAMLVVCLITDLYALVMIPYEHRVSAPFESYSEPNTLGGYLVIMLSLCLGLLLTLRRRRERLALAALALVTAAPILYTFSRASWVALFPMAGALLVFSEKKAVVAAGLIACAAAALLLMPASVAERVSGTFTPEPGFERTQRIGRFAFDPSTSERIEGFGRAFEKWKQRPVFGWGVTGAGFIDGQYFRTLVELGLVGFTVFCYLLYRMLGSAHRVYRDADNPFFRGLALGVLAASFALVVHAAGTNSFIIVRIMEPFWFMLGLLMAYGNLRAAKGAEAPAALWRA